MLHHSGWYPRQSVSIAHPTLDCRLLSPTQLKAQIWKLARFSESDTDGHLVDGTVTTVNTGSSNAGEYK